MIIVIIITCNRAVITSPGRATTGPSAARGFFDWTRSVCCELDVELELVRISMQDIQAGFTAGQLDIVMSGLGITPVRLREFRFSNPPIDITLGFLVPDFRRREFTSYAKIRKMDSLTLGGIGHWADLQRPKTVVDTTQRSIEGPNRVLIVRDGNVQLA